MCQEHAQNEGSFGGSSPLDQRVRGILQGMWAEGPGGSHYVNMANKRYKELAVGIYVDPSGKLWLVNDFY